MSFLKNRNQIILLAANILLVFFLILLSNLHILPVDLGDFIFFAFLILALALYRPGWVFLFFVGTIMLENVNLAPAELGIAVRPYQFFGGLAILALGIRFLTRKLNFKLIKLNVYDWLVILLGAASLVSAIFSNNVGVSLKQSIVLMSFIFLYFLTRNYLQTTEDIKKVVPFFLSSSIVVALYSVWQNVRFARGLSSFEVMPGRPNGTFAEADWLGMFVTCVIAVIYGLIYWTRNKKQETNTKQISNYKFQITNKFSISEFLILKLALYLMLTASYLVLILSVSRSAWLGALMVTFIFLMTVFTNLKFSPKKWQWKKTAQIKIPIIFSILLSVAVVYAFNLTRFELGNRLQSTGSGQQEITVSCDAGSDVPRSIVDISELDGFNCRHINLEDVGNEKISGRVITRAYRNDPNVDIRGEIYKKSWTEIKNNLILGIGWGNISEVLGKDERGAGLNSSNIFLETWLGAGIFGFFAFILIWLGVVVRSLKLFLNDSFEMKAAGMFLILGSVAIIVPNLFNAGLMLGFLWLFLGLTFIKEEK